METIPYKNLQEILKRQILSGVFKEGDLLPSEYDLTSIHKLHRSTVRKALDELVKDGYILKKKGKGSIVNKKSNSLGLLSIQGFSQQQL